MESPVVRPKRCALKAVKMSAQKESGSENVSDSDENVASPQMSPKSAMLISSWEGERGDFGDYEKTRKVVRGFIQRNRLLLTEQSLRIAEGTNLSETVEKVFGDLSLCIE